MLNLLDPQHEHLIRDGGMRRLGLRQGLSLSVTGGFEQHQQHDWQRGFDQLELLAGPLAERTQGQLYLAKVLHT